MRSKPLLIALFATGVSVGTFSTPASADPGAGVIIGGTIGALIGGPPGWVAGMAIGAAIGESEAQRYARFGYPAYAGGPYPHPGYATPPHAVYQPHHASVPAIRVAPPPPGFNGVPPDYTGPRAGYSVQHAPVQYAQPMYAAPRVVYPAPVYYGPRRYYRPYYY